MDLEFGVWGLQFRVWGLGFRFWGLGFQGLAVLGRSHCCSLRRLLFGLSRGFGFVGLLHSELQVKTCRAYSAYRARRAWGFMVLGIMLIYGAGV